MKAQHSYLGNNRGSKVTHIELSDRLKTLSEEVDAISTESAFQGLTECTAKVDTQSDILVCGSKNKAGRCSL